MSLITRALTQDAVVWRRRGWNKSGAPVFAPAAPIKCRWFGGSLFSRSPFQSSVSSTGTVMLSESIPEESLLRLGSLEGITDVDEPSDLCVASGYLEIKRRSETYRQANLGLGKSGRRIIQFDGDFTVNLGMGIKWAYSVDYADTVVFQIPSNKPLGDTDFVMCFVDNATKHTSLLPLVIGSGLEYSGPQELTADANAEPGDSFLFVNYGPSLT